MLKALLAEEKFLEIENSEDLINAFDHQHRIIYWNKTCEDYFGIAKEDALGKVLEDLLPAIKADERIQLLNRALEGKMIHVLNEELKKNQQRYEQKLIPLKNNSGAIVAVLN